jgi:XTP/dITP diphosphohydrolase
MSTNQRVIAATTNPGKLSEIEAILDGWPVELVSPAALGLKVQVDETGATYTENATLKALAYAPAAGLVALGDDSGLEVDALDGAPGLHSARYAGAGKSDSDRYRLLLHQLEGVPPVRRTARFRCVIAVATPAGAVQTAEGVCEGRIALEAAGLNGFGYDPVFFLDEFGCTMAQLPNGVKNTVSHRGRALLAARPLILAALRG